MVKVSTNAFDKEEHWEHIYCHGDDEYYKVEQKAEIKKKEVSPVVQCLCCPMTLCTACEVANPLSHILLCRKHEGF